MQTYCVLLHVFVSLLMCVYGMANTSSEKSLTTNSNNPTSNISMTTAKLTTFTNNLDNTANYTLSPHFTNETGYDIRTYDTSSTDSSETSTAVNSNSYTSPGMKINKDSSGHSVAGIIILVLILILIIILFAILYFLRKKGKSYSFDLTRTSGYVNEYDAPLRDLEQQAPVISFEHKDKDLPACLNYVQDNKSQENSSPIANGHAGETTEITLESEKENLPEESSFPSSPSLTPPMKKVEFNLDLDLIGGESELNSPTPSDACDAAHNENNNNNSHTGCGRAEEIFTDISLDESKEHT